MQTKRAKGREGMSNCYGYGGRARRLTSLAPRHGPARLGGSLALPGKHLGDLHMRAGKGISVKLIETHPAAREI
jgi:hypothetical protein